MKEKSGAPLEYGDEIDTTVDIYKDSWQLAQYMTWYIPASVRDAKGVSIGDGSSQSRHWPNEDSVSEHGMDLPIVFDDDTISSVYSQSNTPFRSRSRGKSDNLESTFANVASSLTTLIQKQNERNETQTVLSQQQQQHNLKYAQMYEELDKILANASFLDAVKFLTATMESANTQFNG